MNESMWDEIDTFFGGVGERYMELMEFFIVNQDFKGYTFKCERDECGKVVYELEVDFVRYVKADPSPLVVFTVLMEEIKSLNFHEFRMRNFTGFLYGQDVQRNFG